MKFRKQWECGGHCAGCRGGLSVEETRELCTPSWVLLSLYRLRFPAALHEGHKASVKLCKSTKDYGHFQ